MKILHIVLPTVALGATAALLLPASTNAFSTNGGALGTSVRDFRVFDNFTDPTANDNVTAHVNFPGYTGAEMAIWKACIEWSSRLHADGNGDPHQNGGLGSGGANFDAVWAGKANGVGDTNDNIHSELAGSQGGTLAFTELPISDGWRIRYLSTWTWNDGPNTNLGGAMDLQGVACHEYGHALGLGHSDSDNTATMFPSVSGSGVAQRSINADDIAGVKFIYGTASATKPVITGVTVGVGTVTITGTFFGSTGNQVWFTPLNLTTPTIDNVHNDPVVKVLNVPSVGGQITVNVPATAGAGDVFVKLSSAGHASLSNGWPYNPQAAPTCPSESSFCLAGANSVSAFGAQASISGSQSIADNNLQLIVTSMPPNKLGLFFYGQDVTAFVPFGNGFRCVAGPFFRLPASTSNIFGDYVLEPDLANMPAGGQVSAGQSWGFQLWYRDPDAGGAFFNASDGILVPFCP